MDRNNDNLISIKDLKVFYRSGGGIFGGAKTVNAVDSVTFDGIEVLGLPIDEVRKIRGKRIAMIFQDPMTSLNPFLKISKQLMEVAA